MKVFDLIRIIKRPCEYAIFDKEGKEIYDSEKRRCLPYFLGMNYVVSVEADGSKVIVTI